MEKSRIAALVDGIFAVAVTLLVLDLKLPERQKISNDAEVWRQLVALRSRFSGGRYRRLNRDFIFQSVHCAKRLLVATSVPFSARAASPPSGGKGLARTGEPNDLIRNACVNAAGV
jgi:hypothetical protein